MQNKLEWEFTPECESTSWWSSSESDGDRWRYRIEARVTENSSVDFVTSRYSENDGMFYDDIGELNRTVASLKEAKAIAEEWHRIRYDDNEQEWQDSGGSTREAEEQMEAEAERHIGVFKCVGCGEAITDPYIIEGDLALTRSASARKRPTRSSIAGTSRPAIVKISFQR
jgi:hypothetical protein